MAISYFKVRRLFWTGSATLGRAETKRRTTIFLINNQDHLRMETPDADYFGLHDSRISKRTRRRSGAIRVEGLSPRPRHVGVAEVFRRIAFRPQFGRPEIQRQAGF